MYKIFFLLFFYDFKTILQLLLFTFKLSYFTRLISLWLGFLFFLISKELFSSMHVISSFCDSISHRRCLTISWSLLWLCTRRCSRLCWGLGLVCFFCGRLFFFFIFSWHLTKLDSCVHWCFASTEPTFWLFLDQVKEGVFVEGAQVDFLPLHPRILSDLGQVQFANSPALALRGRQHVRGLAPSRSSAAPLHTLAATASLSAWRLVFPEFAISRVLKILTAPVFVDFFQIDWLFLFVLVTV